MNEMKFNSFCSHNHEHIYVSNRINHLLKLHMTSEPIELMEQRGGRQDEFN